MLPALGLLLLSALWTVDSLRADMFPRFGADALPSAVRQALLFAVFAASAASIAAARRARWPRGRQAWACAGIGLGLFAAPAALAAFAQDWIPALERVAVFSLTPVFAVVLEPYLEGSAPRQGKAAQGKAALPGALAAVAGMLCLFPLDVPGSLRVGVALGALVAAALSIAAANCLAVRLAWDIDGRSIAPMAALAGAAAAACFAVAAAFAPHHTWQSGAWQWSALWFELPWMAAIGIPALLLLFWLMRRLSASRMTARFLFAPLLTILAGLALERPGLTLRNWLGIGLLAAGAGWLLFGREEEPESKNLFS